MMDMPPGWTPQPSASVDPQLKTDLSEIKEHPPTQQEYMPKIVEKLKARIETYAATMAEPLIVVPNTIWTKEHRRAVAARRKTGQRRFPHAWPYHSRSPSHPHVGPLNRSHRLLFPTYRAKVVPVEASGTTSPGLCSSRQT